MGKKSSKSSMKISRRDKEQHPLNSLIKNLRPKVYIIDSSNFKNLVQELTGNGNSNSPVSSPPPPFGSTSHEVPAIIEIDDHAYQENSLELSFDSSTYFSTPSESPDLQYRPPEPMNTDFPLQYGDIEALLLEMDQISYPPDDACYAMIQQEACAYNCDFSGLI